MSFRHAVKFVVEVKSLVAMVDSKSFQPLPCMPSHCNVNMFMVVHCFIATKINVCEDVCITETVNATKVYIIIIKKLYHYQ